MARSFLMPNKATSRPATSGERPTHTGISGDVLLHALEVTKWRERRRVLDGITLPVQRGEVLMILGTNGAGKSTLMALLAGLVSPDAGMLEGFGKVVGQWGPQERARLGVAFQRPGFSPRLTVREVLAFFALCYDGARPIDELLVRFGLEAVQYRQMRHLSAGQHQRVSVALAFLKAFDVVLLDEPTAGIDPQGRAVVWEEIRQARDRGAAVVCTTHLLDEAQAYSDRLLLLHAGRPIALAPLHELLAAMQGSEKVELTYTAGLSNDVLSHLPGVTDVLRRGDTVTLVCHSAHAVLHSLLTSHRLPPGAWGKLGIADVVQKLLYEGDEICAS